MVDNKLYVANCGDSKAILLREGTDGEYNAINVSKTFNANKLYEKQRLQKLFPKEKDVIVCRSPTSCYVKGGLMPTRSFGDLRLKKKEFNFHDFAPEYGYRKPIPTFTGPYISAEPDI